MLLQSLVHKGNKMLHGGSMASARPPTRGKQLHVCLLSNGFGRIITSKFEMRWLEPFDNQNRNFVILWVCQKLPFAGQNLWAEGAGRNLYCMARDLEFMRCISQSTVGKVISEAFIACITFHGMGFYEYQPKPTYIPSCLCTLVVTAPG